MWFRQENKIRKGTRPVENIEFLPPKNYLLTFDEHLGYALEEQPVFGLPETIYGNEEEFADRVLHTFKQKQGNTGVLMVGKKGTGKTLTAKLIAKKSKLPVILITQEFKDDAFLSFLSNFNQEVVLFVDEFEKVYKNEAQEVYLSVLDGVFSNKKLFLFTSNTFDLETNLKSRPSRVRYLRSYNGLKPETIEQIITDRLQDQTQVEELKYICNILNEVSVDILLTLIEEMNMYNISPKEAIKELNVQVEYGEFDVLMMIDGQRFNTKVYFNPLTKGTFTLEYKTKEGWYKWKEIKMREMDIKFIGRKYQLDSKDGKERLIFTPSKSFEFNF